MSAGQVRTKATTKQTKTSAKGSENRTAQSKGYLKKGTGKTTTSSGPDRTDVIRKMLYEQKEEESQRLERLSTIIPSPEIHETIHRAWQIRLRERREKVNQRLERQYRSIDQALEELRLADLSLYLKTLKDSDGNIARLENVGSRVKDLGVNATGKLPGLFPRQMRIPSESSPSHGKVWDHDWKNPMNPLLDLNSN
ncbi:uncharacterized protein MELLADRAFT_106573 [Melampsora larici-populina 98AG31]|uniref:Large ribosomal subunit protein mL40 n=1 Tax=Melampsora larici-populina (strain 98AG31 / pathotype 3-4-7) TaxID=747676 RepID=F4RLY2_MELLP|nr:uncharacterized protein MELLADRAFT_106573 [Melampsora larici-populina 98AG31]EGG06626.1 hypothetical protein MELLADRAFT_106573 [Melampsora larici-populina 98AG31]